MVSVSVNDEAAVHIDLFRDTKRYGGNGAHDKSLIHN